jgi:AcrR family transcriptional regulator
LGAVDDDGDAARAPRRPTKDRLIDAAVDALGALTATDLVTAVGTREIARRAGVSPAAFFHHFASVADFAQAVIERVYDPGPSPAQITVERLEEIRTAQLPVDTEYHFHEAEFARLVQSPDLPLRVALSIFGGPRAATAYRGYLAALEDRLAAVFGALISSWGREPRPPFDVESLNTTHMALVHGMVLRHRLDSARVGAGHFKRAAVALNLVLLRLVGDRHTVDDRVSEMNYYPLRDAHTGVAVRGRRAVSRARILAAAAELFGSRGYDNTSLAAIARLADVSESTVYEQFASKSRLASALWVKQAADMLAAREPIALSPGPRLRRHLLDLAAFAAAHAGHAAPYLSDLVCHAPAPADGDELRRRTRVEVAGALGAGALRTDGPDADDLADLLLSTVISRVLGVPSEGAERTVAWALSAFGAPASVAAAD